MFLDFSSNGFFSNVSILTPFIAKLFEIKYFSRFLKFLNQNHILNPKINDVVHLKYES